MEAIKKFNQVIEVECYSDVTKKCYQHHIEKFLSYYGTDARQEDIIRHLYHLRNFRKYSPSALTVARASLVYYFEKVLGQKITIDIPKQKRKKSLPRPIEREQIIAMIRHTSNLKHRIIIEMLYSSGMRLGEIVRLKWNELDFVNKVVRINHGKGSKDRLSILSDEVIKHLFDLMGQKPEENEYVFYSCANPKTHITKKTVQKVLENASEKARIGFVVTPHQLRHSFATHSLENGVDIRVIQELLGHSSPKTTMIYTKVTKRNLVSIRSPLDLTLQENVKTNKEVDESSVKSNG